MENDTQISGANATIFWKKRPILQMGPNKPALSTFPFNNPTAKARAAMIFEKGSPVFLVGDALQEPYWPNGEGIGKGFLGVMDAAYCSWLWGSGIKQDEIETARASLFQLSANAPHGLRKHRATSGKSSASKYSYTID